MRSAAKVFYLAVFAFLNLTSANHDGHEQLKHDADTCAVSRLSILQHLLSIWQLTLDSASRLTPAPWCPTPAFPTPPLTK